MLVVVTLNPLFEREWRGRFRRPTTHGQLLLLVSAMMALVCFGIWRIGFLPDMTVKEWRLNGHYWLDTYHCLGSFVFWCGALLLGATSVSDEKASATWEHLLLSPSGGKGLSVGKIASGAAWLLMLQIALFPALLVAGLCFGATPSEVAGVMLSHLLLTLQGATLGFWGALRGNTLMDGLGQSLAAIGRVLGQCVLVAIVSIWLVTLLGFVIRVLLLIPIPVLKSSLNAAWPLAYGLLLWIAEIWGSLVAGVTGVGIPLQALPGTDFFHFLHPVALIVGQVFGIAVFLKLSVWELDYPTRDFWGVTGQGVEEHKGNDHLQVLYRVWSWNLTPEQVTAFPLREQKEPFAKIRSLLPTWERAMADVAAAFAPPATASTQAAVPLAVKTPRANTKRMRAPVSRRWQELNPVLWLDLTRCLSLRSPDSAMLPVLLTLGALGGSVLLAISLFLLIGWVQNTFGGVRGDVSSLGATWEELHWVLLWAALACGPIWGTMGYVIERRTGMLVELRLTLITASEMWWGKFGARFVIFAALSIPVLAIVAFFAWNWPDKNAPWEVASALLSSWALGMWSVCACLWLSDSCRRDLTAALWCGAFGLGWGLLLWNFPTFSWVPVHLGGATLTGGHLFWRLKRLGFG